MTRTIETANESRLKRHQFMNMVKCEDCRKIEAYMARHNIELFVDDEPTCHPLYTLRCINQNTAKAVEVLLNADIDNPYDLNGEKIWIETYKK